jgi:hypothetical protein
MPASYAQASKASGCVWLSGLFYFLARAICLQKRQVSGGEHSEDGPFYSPFYLRPTSNALPLLRMIENTNKITPVKELRPGNWLGPLGRPVSTTGFNGEAFQVGGCWELLHLLPAPLSPRVHLYVDLN